MFLEYVSHGTNCIGAVGVWVEQVNVAQCFAAFLLQSEVFLLEYKQFGEEGGGWKGHTGRDRGTVRKVQRQTCNINLILLFFTFVFVGPFFLLLHDPLNVELVKAYALAASEPKTSSGKQDRDMDTSN